MVFQKGNVFRFPPGYKPAWTFPKGRKPAKPFPKGHTFGQQFQKGNTNGRKHGFYQHALYWKGRGILQRCCNPKAPNYKNYGAIGITIWEPWQDLTTLILGLSVLLGEEIPEGFTIDRLNPHEGYFEWNIRLADASTQRRNNRENTPNFYTQSGEH
jgi:hypothetical protein